MSSIGNYSSSSEFSSGVRFQVSRSMVPQSVSNAALTQTMGKRSYNVSVTPYCKCSSSNSSSDEKAPLGIDKLTANRKKKQFKIVRISSTCKNSTTDSFVLNNFIGGSSSGEELGDGFDPLIDIF